MALCPYHSHIESWGKSTICHPIALTGCLCKVMEQINRKLNYLIMNQLFKLQKFTSWQALRFPKRTSNSRSTSKPWQSYSKSNCQFFFLYFSIIRYRKSLHDRIFAVKLFSDKVTFSDIFCPGKQGSVLSPTLFLCMINDIWPVTLWNLKNSLCADDCALWHFSNSAILSTIDYCLIIH